MKAEAAIRITLSVAQFRDMCVGLADASTGANLQALECHKANELLLEQDFLNYAGRLDALLAVLEPTLEEVKRGCGYRRPNDDE